MIKVGDKYVVERRCHGRLDHQCVATVERITPRRAYLGGGTWIALDDPTRTVRPRYCDFTTTATPVQGDANGGDK
ncbi:MAG: hypothetical protein KF850_33115 [Labilithrix sp.]|nr:hypothetical protein [Labilithrix sp.]MBX3216920.1 hypothetical protein [Labilithrix sp.]